MRVGVLAAAIVCGLFTQASKAAELRVNYPELAALLRAALSGAEIHLNNKPNTGLLALIGPKQSYVKIGATEIPIAVPPHVILGTNYYVHQIASTKIAVAAVKQAVRVSVSFKAEGPAIVASSTAMPWVQWRDAAIDIDFKPIKVARGLSFEVTRVAMHGPFLAFCPPNDGARLRRSTRFAARSTTPSMSLKISASRTFGSNGGATRSPASTPEIRSTLSPRR